MPPSDDSSDLSNTPRFPRLRGLRPGFGADDPSRNTAAFVATTVVLVAVYAYDSLVLSADAPLVAGWRPTVVDLLFATSLAGFALFVVAPLWTDRERTARYWSRLRQNRLAVVSFGYLLVVFVLGLVGPLVFDSAADPARVLQPPVGFGASEYIVSNCVGPTTQGLCRGSLRHPLGTGPYGRDMFSLVVEGMRVAVVIGFVTSMFVVPIATVVGVSAGYLGGWVDTLTMRYVDIQQTLPAFVVYLIAIYVFGRSLFLFLLVFGLLGWGGVARVVRSEVLSLREEPFVVAARSAGVKRWNIVRHHILPHVRETVVVAATRQIPLLVLVEAAISFMNLNDMTLLSWGETIARGTQGTPTVTWWVSTIPVVFLTLTVVSLSVFGDALQDVLDA
ncbi:ABC transporter permease [Haloprofundus sp. MHR1]|uniref:ABC transporter permease n=1 Tax=Haloprofundus sp. MHR1 TaxID=2572921 RepID=UPI0010BF26AA|nr:ABC transporter permease [Haloprofundus sp. MHR1]QCJ48391.1 ABC transporter permease [Haloprofundus sp. MHR1]